MRNIMDAMRGFINKRNGLAGLDDNGRIPSEHMATIIKLLGADADALTIGGLTEEGGDLKVFRNAVGDLQVYIDADAASNGKALDVYGGVVCQNYLTVGQSILNTSYELLVAGTCAITDELILGVPGLRGGSNSMAMPFSIPVTDAISHSICLQIDANDVLCVQATGDGVGGIVGKRSIQYGGQCHAKTDAGASDYNPSIETSDYIISVDTTAAARAVTISAEDRDSGTPGNPRVFIIKDIAGNAATNNITISLETSGTVDGAANVVINSNYGSITVMIDGTNGFVIGYRD